MTKHPYRFPLRSREAMTNFICQDWRCYGARHDSYLFAWNVKVWFRTEDQRNGRAGEEPTRADLNDRWDSYVEAHPDLFYQCCEDAARYYLEDGYSSYPGDDQGDWQFEQTGRSCGYLALASWRGHKLNKAYGEAEQREFCDSLTFLELRAFYRGIVCLDHDLTPEKAAAEVAYHLNFQRAQWESEIADCETRKARRMEAERPDLYPDLRA